MGAHQAKIVQLQVLNNINSHRQNRIMVSCGSTMHIFNVNEVIHLEASGNYSIVHIKNGQALTICQSLGQYFKLLHNSQFIRIHQSHVVNLQHIHQINKNYFVVLSNGKQVSYSRRYKKLLMAHFR